MEKVTRLGWIDVLRIVACFAMVLSHSCDQFVAQFDNSPQCFYTGVFMGSLVRPCVPLFAMMTGVLLFPVNLSMHDFYKKRIGRILIPLIFWSIVLPFLFFVYLEYINPSTQNLSIVHEHTLGDTLRKLYVWIFNFNYDTTPLWYLYMLIGLYLAMPILSVWLKQATQKEIKSVLVIWVIASTLPYLKILAPLCGFTGNYGNMGLLGVCDWNSFGTFYYFSGYIGYLVLAYYLVKYPLNWSWRKILCITVPMFLVGYAVTSFGYVQMQQFFPGNYAYLEIVWLMTGINVLMMTFPVFVIIQKINSARKPYLESLASLTFGIYLCHFVFVQVAYDVYDTAALPPVIRIVFMAITTFVVCCLIIQVMKQWRITRRLIM